MTNESIALNELTATIKRQEIIMNNVEDPEERFVALNILQNLKQIKAHLTEYVKSPAFAQAVKMYQDSLTATSEEETKDDR